MLRALDTHIHGAKDNDRIRRRARGQGKHDMLSYHKKHIEEC